jgi:hypothetical protein
LTGDVAAGAVQALAAQGAIFEALLLLASAGHKAVNWKHLQRVVRQFGGVPRSLSAAALSAVIAAELGAAALLVMPADRAAGGLLATVIWTLYLALIARAVLKGRRDLDCGCSFGSRAPALGFPQIARNSLLALLAAGIAWESATSASVPAQASQVLGGLSLLALYGAMDQVMALRPLRTGQTS